MDSRTITLLSNAVGKALALTIVLVILVFGIAGSYLHNHSDHAFHHDCPVCAWIAVFHALAVVVPLVLFGTLLPSHRCVFYSPYRRIFPPYLARLCPRAPPFAG